MYVPFLITRQQLGSAHDLALLCRRGRCDAGAGGAPPRPLGPKIVTLRVNDLRFAGVEKVEGSPPAGNHRELKVKFRVLAVAAIALSAVAVASGPPAAAAGEDV